MTTPLLSANQGRYEVEAGYLAVRKGWQPTRVQAALMELLRRGGVVTPPPPGGNGRGNSRCGW